ncbi:isopentenyl phosphate kinase [Halococcus hamelinensis]|uniref:Isopentenyl phosphate kinase n=1 Tax=Halococcus hamelinensis 100A6 TaxID=1132509 RepID=M0LW79_9EURY|nr:isopentenyl phosphate kinase [Halococcus hamelinensis]EMA36599.1 aspartate/glutamate/uridylate kinase [Halococcus hamelinensis 100A6]
MTGESSTEDRTATGTTVLKLGGSVITDKSSPETLDGDHLARATDAVAAFEGELVLVHGGGSFGHHHASEHGITTTAGSHDAEGARAVHDAMRRLNDALLDALRERGVPALPVHPLSAATRDDSGELSLATGVVETMLDEGFVPVVQADVVAHAGRGVTVVSGDELVVVLATALDADRVGVCSGVPGVFDTDGVVIDRIDSFADVRAALGGSDATDVTGGMSAKVEALLGLDAPAWVFGLDDLDGFFDGASPGTRVD